MLYLIHKYIHNIISVIFSQLSSWVSMVKRHANISHQKEGNLVSEGGQGGGREESPKLLKVFSGAKYFLNKI